MYVVVLVCNLRQAVMSFLVHVCELCYPVATSSYPYICLISPNISLKTAYGYEQAADTCSETHAILPLFNRKHVYASLIATFHTTTST